MSMQVLDELIRFGESYRNEFQAQLFSVSTPEQSSDDQSADEEDRRDDSDDGEERFGFVVRYYGDHFGILKTA